MYLFNAKLVRACTQKSRLKRKSMYLMQQMQPRAMTESTTATNQIGQNVNIAKEVTEGITGHVCK